MLTLFGSRGSGSCAVELALVRCGLPYRVCTASSWEPESEQAALAALNPLGQIPTLVLADGTVLTESAAILIHLGLECPDSGLLPKAPSARAQVLRGLVFLAANNYAAVGVVDHPERWLPGAGATSLEVLRRGARKRLHHCWDVFAREFCGASGQAGALQRPTALELLALVVSRWSGARAFLARRHPGFSQRLQALEHDPEVEPVFRRHFAARA